MGILDDNGKALWEELGCKKGLLVFEKADGNLQFTYKGSPSDALGLNIMAQEAIVRRAWDVHDGQAKDKRVEVVTRSNLPEGWGRGKGEPVKMSDAIKQLEKLDAVGARSPEQGLNTEGSPYNKPLDSTD